MVRSGAGVHESLSYDWKTSVYDVGLVDIKHKIRILDKINPEAERQAVAFPRVHNLKTSATQLKYANNSGWFDTSIWGVTFTQNIILQYFKWTQLMFC